MKVLLLNPYLPEGLLFYGFMKKIGSKLPPLGLAYIAANLEASGHQVKIIDNKVRKYSLHDLFSEIDRFSPEVIGITTITTHLLYTTIITKYLKRKLENVIIVVGGPHASAEPEQLLKFCEEIDYIIVGEAETSFLKLLNNLNNSELLKRIPGIVYQTRNGNIIKKPPNFITDINELPFPARHLLPMELYRPSPINYNSLPSRSLITSRGCPFNCSYCFKLPSEKVRYNNENKILDEIKILIDDYNAEELIFWDDCFTINKKRLKNLFNLLRKNKIDIPWMSMARTDQITKKNLIELKRNGCWRLSFGIESGDPKILSNMNKNISLSYASQILKFCRKIGIETRIFLILGSPYETRESIKKTIKIAKRLDPDIAQFSYFVPFPKTSDYNYIVQNKLPFDSQYYFKNVYPDYHNLEKLIYFPPEFSEKEIKKFHSLAYFNFYFRFKYIIKRIKSINTSMDLYKNLSISLSVFEDLIKRFL
jgi:radical SAM superfamily enzyme YgiQ (UPF0313 family)